MAALSGHCSAHVGDRERENDVNKTLILVWPLGVCIDLDSFWCCFSLSTFSASLSNIAVAMRDFDSYVCCGLLLCFVRPL